MSSKSVQDNQSEDQKKFDLFVEKCHLEKTLNVIGAIEHYARTNDLSLGAAVAQLLETIKEELKELDNLIA